MTSAKADNNRCAWKYTADDATEYLVSAKAVYVLDGTDGSKYGGEAAEAADKPLPRGFRMRAVKCTSTGHPAKWIPCYTTTATLWTTPGTSVQRDLNGVDVAYTSVAKKRGERTPREGTRDTA